MRVFVFKAASCKENLAGFEAVPGGEQGSFPQSCWGALCVVVRETFLRAFSGRP